MFQHILVPTDGSALSESTVARAVSFAKEAGARITFFYAQPDFPMPIYGEGALIDPTRRSSSQSPRQRRPNRFSPRRRVWPMPPVSLPEPTPP